MVNWKGALVHLPWVYVHSSICETHWVECCSVDLWSIEGMVHLPSAYVLLLYVKLIGCNGVE